jgi:hypothetical protein
MKRPTKAERAIILAKWADFLDRVHRGERPDPTLLRYRLDGTVQVLPPTTIARKAAE